MAATSSGAMVARILSQYSDKGSKQAQKDIKRLGADFDKFANRAKLAFGIAAAASAAFAIKVGIDSVKAAMEDQKSQALLAKSLQNTTYASAGAIAGVEKYIDRLELATGVSDNLLRPSLAALARVTGSVAKAQYLQGIAMDVSAGTGKDLETVSLAISKAVNGNFGALTRLGVPLDKAAIKSKDLNKILKILSNSFAGQAAVLANTFLGRLARLNRAIEQIKEKIGFALLPVLERFSGLLTSKILPQIQKWINLNKDKLAKSLQSVGNFLFFVVQKAIALGTWISTHMTEVKIFAGVVAALFAVGKLLAFATFLKSVAAAWILVRNAAATAAIASAFASGGATLYMGATAIAAIGATFAVFGLDKAFKAAAESAAKIGMPAGIGGVTDSKGRTASDRAAIVAKKQQMDAKKFAEQQIADAKRFAAEQAKGNKASADAAAKALATQKGLNALKALGISTTTETDPIQLEAARQNLVKQALLLRDAETQKQLKLLEVQFATNTAIQRYLDIQTTLSDGKISDVEIVNLAKKWGLSTDAVQAYITRAIGDFKVADDHPAVGIKTSWEAALAALNAYIAGIGRIPSVGGGVPSVVIPTVPGAPSFKADGSDRAGGNFGGTYVSPNTNQQGSAYVNSNGSDRAGGVSNININLSGYDPMGATKLVQDAVQQLARNGSSLSGNSSRGN